MKRDTATVDRVFSEMNTGAEVPSARGGGDGFDLSAGDLAIRTSMNLNHNPRLEDFEISDDPVLADYLDPVTAEIFARQDVGEAMKRDTATVDRVFSEMNTGAEVPSARGGGDGFDLSAGDLA